MKHPGEGKIDYEAFLAHLKEMGYQGSVAIESTLVLEDGAVDVGRMNKSPRFLRELKKG